MCGRITQNVKLETLVAKYGARKYPALDPTPHYNGAPGQDYVAVRNHGGGPVLEELRWGRIPDWAANKPGAKRLINARCETVHEKPSFRSGFRQRRCVVPCNGWFEWKPEPTGKQPYWLRPEGSELFSLAGVWEPGSGTPGTIGTFVILTMAAAPAIADIHHRQPLILGDDDGEADWRRWPCTAGAPLAPGSDIDFGLVRPDIARPRGQVFGSESDPIGATVANVVPREPQEGTVQAMKLMTVEFRVPEPINKIDIAARSALAAIAAAAAIAFVVPGTEVQAQTAGAGTRIADNLERRDAQRRARHLRVLHETDLTAIGWGSERRPNRTAVFQLGEPLERTTGTDAVEVELFSPGLDNDGASDITSCAMSLALGTWWPTLEAARIPVHLAYRQVDEGPGLDERHREGRRTIAELVTGGSSYARNDGERAARLVTGVTRWLRDGATSERVLEGNIGRILENAGIDRHAWEREVRDEIEQTRAINNARWGTLAGQYARWRGHDPKAKRALGRSAGPILLIDGRYLITMNTIRRQGGLRAPERFFQIVNGLIRRELEQRETGGRAATLNYTAAAVMNAAMALGMCKATDAAVAGSGGSAAQNSPSAFLSPEGWTGEQGPVEVLPTGAHVRLKSGKVVQVLFLTPLEGEDGRKAQEFLQSTTRGRTVSCSWAAKAAEEGDPRAVTQEGSAIASCRIRRQPFARCTSLPCRMEYRAIASGYGRLLLGPWQRQTPSTAGRVEELKGAQRKARHTEAGLWGGWKDADY